uniref:RING-type domain-containing protein n=1 Tax=Syphacia muris TaxID=451379 RepID=A0A0N5A947_9BILA
MSSQSTATDVSMQNSTNNTLLSPEATRTSDGSSSLDRIRQMLLTPPASRPPDFENPLEKIEQLLTCPICLDRYKQPRLLPCNHTFCLPCLDNCADVVHRILKCPECRAEHPLPYDGVKCFQPNYTLMGFLDVHLQATDDNAAQLEAYIQRYNLERCKICDEKAELEVCAHCERRACKDCRATHMEMLKRDLSRMLNQVKRLSNRVTEASEGLSKGAELLTLNCETTKDEVKEYFRRYFRDLKKREELFLQEIETFHANETRLMRNLHDVLEIESNNMIEGKLFCCAYLESALKGEREIQDAELVKFKNVFSEGLEYLRNFQPDADELFSKKLRFSPGDDASKLPSAIANFGELTVLLPQFAGRYLPLEQSYLPKAIKLGYESDNYKFSSRRNDGDDTHTETRQSRYSRNEDDMMSIRFRRRQQMEEEAWNRLRVSNTDNGRQSPGFSNRHSFRGSPWSKTVLRNNSKAADEEEVKADNNDEEKRVQESARPTSSGQQLLSLILPKPALRKSSDVENSKSPKTCRPLSTDVESVMPTVSAAKQSSVFNQGLRKGTLEQGEAANDFQLQRNQEKTGCSDNKKNSDVNNQKNNTNNRLSDIITSPKNEYFDPQLARAEIKITRKPPLPRQASSDDTSLNEKIENIRAAHEKRRLHNRQVVEPRTDQQNENLSSEENDSGTESNQPATVAPTRFRIISRTSSGYDVPKTIQSPTTTSPQTTLSNTTVPQTETPLDTSLPIPITHYPGEIPPWLLRRRQRFQRSKTNPDMTAIMTAASNYYGTTSISSVTSSNPSSISRIQQLLFERSNRLDSTTQRFIPPPPRQDSTDASNTTDTDAPISILSDRRSRFRRRSAANHRESSADSRISKLLSNKYISTIDYPSKAKPRLVFGKKGCKDGDLNWPRGLTVISSSDFAVCDSSNHRICIFNTQGRLLRTFGKYGTGNGQLDSAAGICCNRLKQLIVSDRYNHRITIFDQNGHFLSSFGGHGPSNGRFNNPWGVAVDDGGMIYVVDKDNHRVQIFDAKGQFVSKFGSLGSGPGQLHNPQFIAIHRRTHHLYVTDSSNHRVSVFDHNGNSLYQFGEEGFHNGQLKFPRGIAVDDQGFIIVADSGNNRVQIFNPDGQFVHTFGSWGIGPGQLKGIEAVTLMDNIIIVSDRENHRIQLF